VTGARREMPPFQSVRFRREREQSWLELEALIEQVRTGGIGSLSAEQLEAFPLLHRAALSSLSVARAIALDRALIAYLDSLALRSFLAFYAPPADRLGALRRFLAETFPRTVRALRVHVALALAALILGIVAGYVLTSGDEHRWFEALVPAGLAGDRGPASSREELLQGEIEAPVPENALSAMATSLFSHNTLVALLAFGFGLLAGVPAILLTVYQGLALGAFVELHVRRGLGLEFAGWIGIHGVTELLALVLFAAAGLRLGELLVFPTESSRADAFALHGPAAAKVAAGAVGMLAVAAVLEGYFRQAVQSTDARLAIALLSLIAWSAYFAFAGRRAER
jgi:uncharacterized membrane protein SpoIIM required for sporulation